MSEKKDDRDLEKLRALVVDLTLDGAHEQAAHAARMHDVLKDEIQKRDGK